MGGEPFDDAQTGARMVSLTSQRSAVGMNALPANALAAARDNRAPPTTHVPGAHAPTPVSTKKRARVSFAGVCDVDGLQHYKNRNFKLDHDARACVESEPRSPGARPRAVGPTADTGTVSPRDPEDRAGVLSEPHAKSELASGTEARRSLTESNHGASPRPTESLGQCRRACAVGPTAGTGTVSPRDPADRTGMLSKPHAKSELTSGTEARRTPTASVRGESPRATAEDCVATSVGSIPIDDGDTRAKGAASPTTPSLERRAAASIGTVAEGAEAETAAREEQWDVMPRCNWLREEIAVGEVDQAVTLADRIEALAADGIGYNEVAASHWISRPYDRGRLNSLQPLRLNATKDVVQEDPLVADEARKDVHEPELETYSFNRKIAADDATVAVSPFPRTNVHEPKPAPGRGSRPAPPKVRPKCIRAMFLDDWYDKIMKFAIDSLAYETAGRAGGKKRRGRGVKRPADVIVPPEALKPEYRGHCWYFVDHLKSGGKLPILTIEEAVFGKPTLSAEAAKLFGGIYGDASVTHTLVYGHHDNSQCERKTVLSCNHKGSLRFWQEVNATFEKESSVEVGWLHGPLEFLPCFPCRVEPCNAVAQNSKVRITTDKSWPKDGEVLSVNEGINLEKLGITKFCRVLDLSRAVAILLTAQPVSASDDDTVYLWKIDLTAAYRQIHIDHDAVWNRGKSWCGKFYLDVRAQFGDASQVKSFQDISDMIVGVTRMAIAGNREARAACDFMSAEQWAAIDASSAAKKAWSDRRAQAGLSDDDLLHFHLQAYLDDFLGAAVGLAAANAHFSLVLGILTKLGFPVNPRKVTKPTRMIEALGADVCCDTRIVKLAPAKAESYKTKVAEVLQNKFVTLPALRETLGKLQYAAQFEPAARSRLGACFAALRRMLRRKAGRHFMTLSIRKDLEWWLVNIEAMPGVALFPRTGASSGKPGVYYFDASSKWGAGGAFIARDGVCYYWQRRWRDGEGETSTTKGWHINVGESYAGLYSLMGFTPIEYHDFWNEFGDNRVANASARRGTTPNACIAEVLRWRADFSNKNQVASCQTYVNTKDNVMADPLSRGDDEKTMKLFYDAARARGATSFVRIKPIEELEQLADNISAIALLEEHDDDTVYGEPAGASTEDDTVGAEPDTAAAIRFEAISGFAGIDSTAQAIEQLGGIVSHAFDNDDDVQRVHDEIYQRRCWGSLAAVHKAMENGTIERAVRRALLYTAGTPCPDWSQAGCKRGPYGHAGGGLWYENIDFIVLCMFPVVILEQVTGILEVDHGFHLAAAVERLRDAGYRVRWRVRRCQRSGDRTTRRRVFVVAVLPRFLRHDVSDDQFFTSQNVPVHTGLEEIADAHHDPELVYNGSVEWLPRDADVDYDGPALCGRIGNGGIGMHVYDAGSPAVTQKTTGEGEGAATGLYRFSDGVVRRLSPCEALQTHSFPISFVERLYSLGFPNETLQRFAGNSIPIMTLRGVISHVLSLLDPTQFPSLED